LTMSEFTKAKLRREDAFHGYCYSPSQLLQCSSTHPPPCFILPAAGRFVLHWFAFSKCTHSHCKCCCVPGRMGRPQQQQPVHRSAIEAAGLWSKISFSWVGPLISKGWHTLQLKRDDAQFLMPHDTDAPQLSQTFEAAYGKLKVGCTAAAAAAGAAVAAFVTFGVCCWWCWCFGRSNWQDSAELLVQTVHRDGLHQLAVLQRVIMVGVTHIAL
jgi:hypothetical protein